MAITKLINGPPELEEGPKQMTPTERGIVEGWDAGMAGYIALGHGDEDFTEGLQLGQYMAGMNQIPATVLAFWEGNLFW